MNDLVEVVHTQYAVQQGTGHRHELYAHLWNSGVDDALLECTRNHSVIDSVHHRNGNTLDGLLCRFVFFETRVVQIEQGVKGAAASDQSFGTMRFDGCFQGRKGFVQMGF